MMLVRHLWRVILGLLSHGVRTRNLSLIVLVGLGGLVVVATVIVQVVGPVALYPFV